MIKRMFETKRTPISAILFFSFLVLFSANQLIVNYCVMEKWRVICFSIGMTLSFGIAATLILCSYFLIRRKNIKE
jgi:uncharacterized membrane protein YccC